MRASLQGGITAAIGCVAGAMACAAALAGDGDCDGYGSLADNPALAIGRIAAGVPRTPFVRNESDAKICPGSAEICRAGAYLVPGNTVIVGRMRGDYVCAEYIGAKGASRAGWLPAAAVTRLTNEPVAVSGWVGEWTRLEASITIKPAATPGELAGSGEATFGASDPGRVKRGAVNTGEIAGRRAPNGANLNFAMNGGTTVPIENGDETNCKVWMRCLGPYLIVDDNNGCGGMNVSFRGVYARKP